MKIYKTFSVLYMYRYRKYYCLVIDGKIIFVADYNDKYKNFHHIKSSTYTTGDRLLIYDSY